MYSKSTNVKNKSCSLTIVTLDVLEFIQDSSIPAPEGTNWVIGNPMQYGYYRVNYLSDNWQRLIDQLNSNHEVSS